MKQLAIYPYKMSSESATMLAEKLDVWKVYPDGKYSPGEDDAVINWGNGSMPKWYKSSVPFLNHPDRVMASVNKRKTFKAFKAAGVPCPPWTEDDETALGWLQNGKWVCCRQKVEGMDGDGLVLAKNIKDFAVSKLYSQFVPSDGEYRVYTFLGKVIDVLKKQATYKSSNPHIRTTGNEWIFVRKGVALPSKQMGEVAIAATKAVGLDFAGIDLLWDGKKALALETNTAPDIGEITADKFVVEIKEWLQGL